MNARLQKALTELAQLPEAQQDSIASLILDEIEAARGWDRRFAATQGQLAELVRRARDEVARGDVLPYDPSDRPIR